MPDKRQLLSCNWPRCVCKATGQYCSSKPSSGPKPKKAIAKRSEKGKVKAINKKTLIQTDMVFYLEIWEDRLKVDFESGEMLGDKPLLHMFHHVLPKRESGGFPQYRHCKWNIVLVSKDTHNLAETNLDAVPKIRAYTRRLLKLHEEGKLAKADPDLHYI